MSYYLVQCGASGIWAGLRGLVLLLHVRQLGLFIWLYHLAAELGQNIQESFAYGSRTSVLLHDAIWSLSRSVPISSCT